MESVVKAEAECDAEREGNWRGYLPGHGDH